MKFRSPDDEPRRVTAGLGAWTIGTEWRELPKHAEAEAYAAGCISQAMTKNQAEKSVPDSLVKGIAKQEMEKKKVKEIVKMWYMDPNNYLDCFKKNKDPSVAAMTKALGYKTQEGYVRAAGHEVRQELGIRKGELFPADVLDSEKVTEI